MTFAGAPDTRPKRIVLIRHGESLRNKHKKDSVYFEDEETRNLFAGMPDHKVPLTPEGHEQARLTGIGLRKDYGVPDYVYHSGYTRTIETADDALKAYTPDEFAQIKVRMDSRLRERDAGWTHGMTKAEAEGFFPWLASHWKTTGGFIAQPPGGESLLGVSDSRVFPFLDMIYRRRVGETVFIFCHGGTKRCFRFNMEHMTYDEAISDKNPNPRNCGVTVYDFDPEQNRMVQKVFDKIYWEQVT